MRHLRRACLLLAAFGLAWTAQSADAARIEELCDVKGVRSNQLIGYGLVVGLNNTGDTGQARFTVQSTAAMLRRLGATIDPRTIRTRNAAAVMVTATLPGAVQPGTRIDVVVSSLGNARSLLGGTLLQTPLYAADRRVYAVAQGPLLIGGYSASGRTGSSVQRNHTTTARVPQGAIVERDVPTVALAKQKSIVLTLREPSFVTAQRIAEAINTSLGDGAAAAVSAGSVRMNPPQKFRGDPVGLLATVQLLEVEPDTPVRVVIDERTGTVALGAGVRIAEVAVAHGGLTVEINESVAVSQPQAQFGQGSTAVVPQSDVRATSEQGNVRLVKTTAELSDVVNALNALGARPRDLVGIFQALRTAGALRADIEVQ